MRTLASQCNKCSYRLQTETESVDLDWVICTSMLRFVAPKLLTSACFIRRVPRSTAWAGNNREVGRSFNLGMAEKVFVFVFVAWKWRIRVENRKGGMVEWRETFSAVENDCSEASLSYHQVAIRYSGQWRILRMRLHCLCSFYLSS